MGEAIERPELVQHLTKVFREAHIRRSFAAREASLQLDESETPVMANTSLGVTVDGDRFWSRGGAKAGPIILLTDTRLWVIGTTVTLVRRASVVCHSMNLTDIVDVPDIPRVALVFATRKSGLWPLQDTLGHHFVISLGGAAWGTPRYRKHALAFVDAVRESVERART